MYVEWYEGVSDPDEKAKIDREILSAQPVLERLGRILTKKEDTLDRQEMNIEVYNMPNWSHRQAHKNGQRSSLGWLKKLVALDQQKQETKNDDRNANTDFYARTGANPV